MRREATVPEDALAAIRAPFAEARGEAVDAPLLQPLGLLLDLAGESIRERLFVVQGGESSGESCLRPDFTIPTLTAHLESGRASGRYAYEGKAYRVAPAHSGEAEAFLQIGLEAFEAAERVEADAEIAALAWASASAGGREDLSLQFGDVGLFAAFLEALKLAEPLAARLARIFSQPRRLRAELARAGAPSDANAPAGRLTALLAGLPEAEAAAALEELWTLAGIDPVGGRTAAEIVHRLADRAALAKAPSLTADQAAVIGRYLAIADTPEAALRAVAALAGPGSRSLDQALSAWEHRLKAMAADGVPLDQARFATAFGREFAYYDGVLFEIRSAALGEGAPVAAGGRYDSLPGRLGARRATGAVGCMVRPARAYAGGGQ